MSASNRRSRSELTVGVDSYYKQATDLIDEGQFGAPIILTPFNYADGQVYGVEFTANYSVGHFQSYANIAVQRAIGKDIVTGQFNFAADDLAWIANHYIHLDHEQQVTASAGASYEWLGTRISGDLLLGSGLRRDLTLPDGQGIPNGDRLPYYEQVNLGVSHDFDRQGVEGTDGPVRCDQCAGQEVRDPRWDGDWRRSAPVRAAARLFRGRNPGVLSRWRTRMRRALGQTVSGRVGGTSMMPR